MNKELQLFIIWDKARYKEKEILNDISQKFEIIKTFSINWSKEEFAGNLSRLYGKKLQKSEKKQELCGSGEFLLVAVNDHNPNYIESKNTNMSNAKRLYREWTNGGHLIHASDNFDEAHEHFLLLLGADYENKLNQSHKTQEKINGLPIWQSEEEMLGFISKLPETSIRKVQDTHLITTQNVAKMCRMLHATRKLFFMKRNLYHVNIGGINKQIYIRKPI